MIFKVTSPLALFFKILVFPFWFLRETITSADSGWGPDCASPVSTNDRDPLYDYQFVLMLLFASGFGGMHFITWSFSMATVTELWMWRFASIALTSLPILSVLCVQASLSLGEHWHSIEFPLVMLAMVSMVLHPVIRLVIAVDSVVLLRSLPDTAFLVLSWSDAIPSL